jgi:hypothetical protein
MFALISQNLSGLFLQNLPIIQKNIRKLHFAFRHFLKFSFRRNSMRKFLPILFAVIFCISTAFGQTKPVDTDGDGYYNISTLDELRWVSENDSSWSWNFELDNDIDASDTRNWNVGDHDGDPATPDSSMGWSPIGQYECESWAPQKSFSGTFNGREHSIENLYINNREGNYNKSFFGFFGSTDSLAMLDGIFIKNCNVSHFPMQGAVGGLVGFNCGTITNCSSSGGVYFADNGGGLVGYNLGTINNSLSECVVSSYSAGYGSSYGGGLVGYNSGIIDNSNSNGYVYTFAYSVISCGGGLVGYNYNTINNSYSMSDVASHSISFSASSAGGLVGYNFGIINTCYSSGSVISSADSSAAYFSTAGGLIGFNIGRIYNNYSTGNISLLSSSKAEYLSYVGGLIGHNDGTVDNCYSTGIPESTEIDNYIGGLLGIDNFQGNFTSSGNFWDIETSGIDSSAGGTGLPTAQMKTKSTFTDAGWDFENIWDIDGTTNDGYPFLRGMPASSVEDEVTPFPENEIAIYPNPAEDMIRISSPPAKGELEGVKPALRQAQGPAGVMIYDYTGNAVYSGVAGEIDISFLPPGVYFVRMASGTDVKNGKFVKR